MTIQNGDIFIWKADDADKYYFIEHDLASISDTLQGLHWCRIYLEPKNGREMTGYRTILNHDYFEDLSGVLGERFIRIEDTKQIERLTARFAHLQAPIRHHR
jgi:hypothetical protein